MRVSTKARAVVVILATLLLATAALGADWPQWRGPTRDGISKEKGLLKQWPQGGPRLLWHVKDAGEGYSTPAVAGDRVYLLGSKGLENEYVAARSAKDGKQIWSVRLGKVGNPDQQPPYPGARSTPTVDGDVLYALGSDGDLACLRTADGKERWRKSLRRDFGGQPGKWAYAESPLVDGNVLVVTPGGAEATIAALDKKTGEVVWKSAIPGGEQAGYASVIATDAGGKKQYVQFLQKGVVGVDAKTGKFLWRYDKTAQGSPANIPTPVARDGLVYSASGRGGGGLVRLTADGDSVNAEQVYAEAKLPTAIGGVVLVGDHLYGTSGQGLMCIDFKTGQQKWFDRSVGAGGVLYADGMLYVFGENAGETALVEATPQGYREKGRFTPPDVPAHERGRKAWAYPVVANGKLYLRDWDRVWCYDVRGGGEIN
jgi:outer membrane protein assembly factor BamB